MSFRINFFIISLVCHLFLVALYFFWTLNKTQMVESHAARVVSVKILNPTIHSQKSKIIYKSDIQQTFPTMPPPSVTTNSSYESDSIDSNGDLVVEYPRASRAMGEQGTVQIEINVNLSGKIQSVQIIKSSGFERLDQAAIQAIKNKEFIRSDNSNKSNNSLIRMNVQFELKD